MGDQNTGGWAAMTAAGVRPLALRPTLSDGLPFSGIFQVVFAYVLPFRFIGNEMVFNRLLFRWDFAERYPSAESVPEHSGSSAPGFAPAKQ